MKYMDWNNEDYDSAPVSQIREIIAMMNEGADEIRRAHQFDGL